MNEDQERQEWSEEVRKRAEFIEETQDALAHSIEFATLANAYAHVPQPMTAIAFRQLANFAVTFVTNRESQRGK